MGIFANVTASDVAQGLGVDKIGTDLLSALGVGGESARRKKGHDELFTSEGDFVFVLHGTPEMPSPRREGIRDLSVDAAIANTQTSDEYVFPLVLNPTEYRFERTFANEFTPTQHGKVYVEDNGSFMGKLFLSGTFGFKPRAPRDKFGIDRGVALSGSKHLQRFEKDFIGFYSKIKKDPDFAEFAHQVFLTFHDSKNGRHVEVVPDRVIIKNSTSGIERLVGSYEIECTIIGEAKTANFVKPGPNKSWLDKAKDIQRVANDAVDVIRATVRDLTAYKNELDGIVSNFGVFLNNIEGLGNDIEIAKDGRLTSIRRPLNKAIIQDARNEIDTIIFKSLGQDPDQAGEQAVVPTGVEEKLVFLDLHLAMVIAFGSELFREDTAAKQQALTNRERGAASRSQEELDNADAKTTLTRSDLQSTAATPGDADLNKAGYSPILSENREYSGYRQIVVRQGDTIEGIASREMGNVDLWHDIVIVNDLKPPFISIGGFPGVVAIGDKLLIPVIGGTDSSVFSTGNPATGASQEEAALGTDFKLAVVGRNAFGDIYDWAVDKAGGSVDFKKVSGVANITQWLEVVALGTRVGTNILYPNLGMKKIVGEKGTPEIAAEARYRAALAMESDLRIESIQDISFSRVDLSKRDQQADLLKLDFNVKLKSINGTRPIAVTVK